jgi:predicted lipoprotein with Yx(FWY)xxD motif
MNAAVSAAQGGSAMKHIRLRKFAAVVAISLMSAMAGTTAAPAADGKDAPWSPVEVSVFQRDDGVFIFTNDFGIPLFINDRDKRGKVGCDEECTQFTWLPLWARDAAKPQGDWSIVMRPDGTPQWAYKKQPVYNYNGRETREEILELAKEDGHWKQLDP